MRWFLSTVAALFLIWAWYMASPYLALWNLAVAVEQGNSAAVVQRVNMYALRMSLAQQLAAEEMRAAGRQGVPRISSADQQLAAAALAILADPVMERLLTSEGTLNLLRSAIEPRDPTGAATAGSGRAISLNRAPQFLAASRWRGFRNVYFSLPPNRAPDQRFRLQLRFSRLAWRLVGIELPPAIRERLAKELAKRARAAE